MSVGQSPIVRPVFELKHVETIFPVGQEIDEMIRMCDSDGDGQVTFDEFYKMMTTPAPPLPPPVNSNKKKPYSDKLGGAKRLGMFLSYLSVSS